MRVLALAALVPLVLLRVAAADAQQVDLQLVLAADVSRSIDEDEFNLQREGYAGALLDPKVIAAIQNGPLRSIAVSFVEWSGVGSQKIVVDWTVIRDEESAGVVAATLRSAPRSFAGFTSISNAVDFSLAHFAKSGLTSERRIIDVSGDGTNNGGRPIGDARDEAVAAGVTINGLAIINQHPNVGYVAHTQPPEGIGEYFRRNVTGGPGSFVIVIEDFSTFADAIVSKLVNEIAAADRRVETAAAR